MTTRSKGRRLAAVFLASLAVLCTPLILLAHARLVRSTPAANAKVSPSPTDITLWFSERPELKLTVIQLLDSTGAVIPLGAPTVSEALAVRAAVPRALAPGRYTVSWRTAADDGHPSSGKFSFRVEQTPASPSGSAAGAASAVTPIVPSIGAATSPSAAETQSGDSVIRHKPVSNALLVPDDDGSPVSTAVRWAELVALLTLVGVVIFRLAILPAAKWPDELTAESADRALRLGRAVLLLFAVATLSRAFAQADLLPAGGSRMNSLVTLIRGTRWGFGWAVGAVGAVIALLGLQTARRATAGWLVAALGVVAIATSEALTGHSASSTHMAVAVAADVSHLLGAGGWLGGLTAVLLCAMPAIKRLDADEASFAGSAMLRGYHGSAIECVTIVVVSALLTLWTRLPTVDALWRTPYGLMVIRKMIFVVVVLLFGLYHWRRVITREWTADTRFRFMRSAIAELLFGAVVVAITAVLVSTPLP